MKHSIILLAVFLACAGRLGAQGSASIETRSILRLQDRRQGGDTLARIWRKARDPLVRERVMIACANIRQGIPSDLPAAGLADSSAEVRREAAFALGRIGGGAAAEALMRAAAEEKNARVAEEICSALGKIVGAVTLDSLLRLSAMPLLRPVSPAAYCILIARCAVRRVNSPRASEFLRRGAESPDASARYWSAYAMSRIRDAALLSRNGKEILSLCVDREGETRTCAVAALPFISDTAQARNALLRAFGDRDWRVRVAAARSAAALTVPGEVLFPGRLLRLAGDRMDNAAIGALQALQACAVKCPDECIKRAGTDLRRIIASAGRCRALRREAALALAALQPSTEPEYFLRQAGNGKIDSASAVEALGLCRGSASLDALLALTAVPVSPRVACALVGSLRSVLPSADAARRGRIVSYLVRCLFSGDIALVTTAAEACGDSLVRAAPGSERIPAAAVSALSGVNALTDVEPIVALCDLVRAWNVSAAAPLLEAKLALKDRVVRAAAGRALAAITGKAESAPDSSFAPAFSDEDWDYLDGIRPAEEALVETSRGAFVVRFLPRDAPFSVLRILKLIDRGFYDGLAFHRVVPGFVIQGGDPRGDGWGGPGWTMRTECTSRRFLRGSVGIASAGEDTEGSQLFVTHCATPHLDGRYTVIGEVVRGMNVVDRIQAGDAIRSIRRIR